MFALFPHDRVSNGSGPVRYEIRAFTVEDVQAEMRGGRCLPKPGVSCAVTIVAVEFAVWLCCNHMATLKCPSQRRYQALIQGSIDDVGKVLDVNLKSS